MGKLYLLRPNPAREEEILSRIEEFSKEKELQELRDRVVELEAELQEALEDKAQIERAYDLAIVGIIILGIVLLTVSPLIGKML